MDFKTGRVIAFDFLRLQSMHKSATNLKEHKYQLAPFVRMFEWLKKNDTRGKDIRCAVDNINKINSLR